MSEQERKYQEHRHNERNPGKDQSLANEDEDPSLLVRREMRQGSVPGNMRVRLVRPSHPSFRRISTGLLEATEETEAPRNTMERLIHPVKRLFIGAPLATIQAEHERLTKFKALAVLSSDAISSVA